MNEARLIDRLDTGYVDSNDAWMIRVPAQVTRKMGRAIEIDGGEEQRYHQRRVLFFYRWPIHIAIDIMVNRMLRKVQLVIRLARAN